MPVMTHEQTRETAITSKSQVWKSFHVACFQSELFEFFIAFSLIPPPSRALHQTPGMHHNVMEKFLILRFSLILRLMNNRFSAFHLVQFRYTKGKRLCILCCQTFDILCVFFVKAKQRKKIKKSGKMLMKIL